MSLCHLRCPDGKLAKSCEGPEVMGRVDSGGEFSVRLLPTHFIVLRISLS